MTPREHAMALAQIRALEVGLERAKGRWTDVPAEVPLAPQEYLSAVLESYLKEKAGKISRQTESEWRLACRRFISQAGDLPVASITKAHVRTWKESLMSLPVSTGRRLSTVSVQKNMAALGAVLSWAMRNGYCETNAVAGLLPENGHRAEADRRLPYTPADLERIFAKLPEEQGAKYWMPILGLYTGARLEELGQLHVADVKESAGVHYLDLAPGDGKNLKNRGSRRQVPLHPEVIRLGFLEYVSQQQGARLFPELRSTVTRKLTSAFSKWYRRFQRKCGLADPRLVYHSYRHTFKDACRAAGLPEEIHDALTGHSKGGSVGRSYGLGVPLKIKSEAVAKLYPAPPTRELRP